MPPVDNLIEESWLATEILLIHMFKMRENTNLLATVGIAVGLGHLLIGLKCFMIVYILQEINFKW